MSFDQDPNEQAQISGADFALMCDEIKKLKAMNAELAEALKFCTAALRHALAVIPSDDRLYGKIGITEQAASAALAKHKEAA